MSVYSMTGYASLQTKVQVGDDVQKTTHTPLNTQLHMELRTVNSRFLDMSFKLSDELRLFEHDLRSIVQQNVRRGKVELRAYLRQEATNPNLSAHMPSTQALQQAMHIQAHIQSWLPQAGSLSVADVMRMSASTQHTTPDAQQLHKQLHTSTKQLIEQLKQARAAEGKKLAHGLHTRCAQLRDYTQQFTPLIPHIIEQQRQRFLDKWQAAIALNADSHISTEAAQERALSEAAAFALRIDVGEELERLQAHIEAIEALLEKGEAIGKRLDFLIQELHREANTLGSKSASLEGTRMAMDMKVVIEQMREQVQNIE